MKTKDTSQSRRSFLENMRGLGLLGAAAVIASRSTKVSAAPPPEEAAAPEPKQEGYHETERIRKYYDGLRRM